MNNTFIRLLYKQFITILKKYSKWTLKSKKNFGWSLCLLGVILFFIESTSEFGVIIFVVGIFIMNSKNKHLDTKILDRINSFNDPNSGHVYVLINQSMPSVVKIGKTTRDPESRAREISSSTGVPTPFLVAYSKQFSDCHKAEKYIHNLLSSNNKRVNDQREFFDISSTDAINILINIPSEIESIDNLNNIDRIPKTN